MVVANGVRLNVTEIPARRSRPGDRAQIPTIFIHGLAASSAFWYGAGASVISVLGPCILYDLRGHGKSETPDSGYAVTDMAADLIGLLDHFGYDRVNLVAHSFGGMIALYAALEHPDRVASLSLVDVRVRPLQSKLAIKARKIAPAIARRLEAVGIKPESLADNGDGIHYLNAVARIQVAAGDEAGEFLNAIYQHAKLFKSPRNARKWIALTENAAIVASLKDESAFDAKDIARLSLPMMILVGQESPTLNSARAVREMCQHAVYHEVPGMGHFFPVSSPRQFVRPALRFLRAVSKGNPKLGKTRDTRSGSGRSAAKDMS